MIYVYEIPAVQGDTGLHKAVSVMLRRYLKTYAPSMPADPLQ